MAESSFKEFELKMKDKKRQIFGSGIILAFISLMAFSGEAKGKSSKLKKFGYKIWSLECRGAERVYRLSSTIPKGSNKLRSLSDRDLNFHDQNETIRYNTKLFDKSSLDESGVWRFKYRKWDGRLIGLWNQLLGKKDKEKVLKGDERVFEIAEDFKSMVIITKDNQNLKLKCELIKIEKYPWWY